MLLRVNSLNLLNVLIPTNYVGVIVGGLVKVLTSEVYPLQHCFTINGIYFTELMQTVNFLHVEVVYK